MKQLKDHAHFTWILKDLNKYVEEVTFSSMDVNVVPQEMTHNHLQQVAQLAVLLLAMKIEES